MNKTRSNDVWDNQSRKEVRGLVATAHDETIPNPALYAILPAITACRKASAIATGFPATAIAVLTRTASAPISIASAA